MCGDSGLQGKMRAGSERMRRKPRVLQGEMPECQEHLWFLDGLIIQLTESDLNEVQAVYAHKSPSLSCFPEGSSHHSLPGATKEVWLPNWRSDVAHEADPFWLHYSYLIVNMFYQNKVDFKKMNS